MTTPALWLLVSSLMPIPWRPHTSAAYAVTPDAAHEIHVSYGRLAVEGGVAVGRIRFFSDDLERALRVFHDRPDLRLHVDAASDSLYLGYLNATFFLVADGERLQGTITASGEERDMWWYSVRYEAPRAIRSVRLTHRMLIDVLPDQRNILKVAHFPSGREETVYFIRGAETRSLAF